MEVIPLAVAAAVAAVTMGMVVVRLDVVVEDVVVEVEVAAVVVVVEEGVKMENRQRLKVWMQKWTSINRIEDRLLEQGLGV
jgi:hypothetical protein